MTIYWALKKYEDTGLTPEQVRELTEAEKQGLILRLPCRVDETTKVYKIYRFCGEGAWEIDEHRIMFSDLKKIGKTVFLTREEAEAKLAEMEEAK